MTKKELLEENHHLNSLVAKQQATIMSQEYTIQQLGDSIKLMMTVIETITIKADFTQILERQIPTGRVGDIYIQAARISGREATVTWRM